jgi:hypothetical protein
MLKNDLFQCAFPSCSSINTYFWYVYRSFQRPDYTVLKLQYDQYIMNWKGYRRNRASLILSTGICLEKLRVPRNTSQDKGSPDLNSETSEYKYLTVSFRLSCIHHPHHNLLLEATGPHIKGTNNRQI